MRNYVLFFAVLGLLGRAADGVGQNLVPNGSFEEYEVCPETIGFQLGDRPTYWRSWFNSPEYFHSCAGELQSIDTLVDVPANGWTFQYPWDGEAYVGFRTFDAGGDYREYVGAPLLATLVPGCTYRLRMRVNPAYDGTYWLTNGGGVCNNVGLLFTMTSNAWAGLSGPHFELRNYAHLFSAEVIADTVEWVQLYGEFTADSAYSYVVLGNFFSDAMTTAYPNDGSTTDLSFYLIDSVSVEPIDASCTHVGSEESALARPPIVRLQGSTLVADWFGDYSASVHDIFGRPLLESKRSNRGQVELDLSSVTGLYFLELRKDDCSFVHRGFRSE